MTKVPAGRIIVPDGQPAPAVLPGKAKNLKGKKKKTIMNIETLELIHKLLTEHVDNASRCCDRARGKRNSTPDDDQNYERYNMKLREADKAMAANRIRILWICLCRYTRKEAMENEAT